VTDRRLVAAAVAVAVAAADQVATWAVVHESARLPLWLIDDAGIAIAHNSGISFSRFAGGGTVLAAVIGLVCVGLAMVIWRGPRGFAVPVAFVLGGAAGNLVDRIRLGYVVDYLTIGPWPTFNLADISILVGAVLIVLRVLRPQRAGVDRTSET
jgi:signal peptidase II